jgi:hypothetical protein
VIAKRYHYTIDEFAQLTPKQISFITKTIDKNSFIENKFRAELHGHKMEDRIDLDDFEVDEDVKEKLDKIAKERFKKWPPIKV